jgi:hypothetical protein
MREWDMERSPKILDMRIKSTYLYIMDGTFPQLRLRPPSEFGYIIMPSNIQVDTMHGTRSLLARSHHSSHA